MGWLKTFAVALEVAIAIWSAVFAVIASLLYWYEFRHRQKEILHAALVDTKSIAFWIARWVRNLSMALLPATMLVVAFYLIVADVLSIWKRPEHAIEPWKLLAPYNTVRDFELYNFKPPVIAGDQGIVVYGVPLAPWPKPVAPRMRQGGDSSRSGRQSKRR